MDGIRHPRNGWESRNDDIGFFVGDSARVGESCDVRFDGLQSREVFR